MLELVNLFQARGIYVTLLLAEFCCIHYVQCELTALSVIGKPTSQSSRHASYLAMQATDGDISSFSHTRIGDSHPWWRVDLDGEHRLGKITVRIRGDCCGFRFIGATVRAGVSSNYTENQMCGLPATPEQSYNGAVNAFLCDPPVMAKYVSIDIDPSSPGVREAILQIAELTVEEYTSRECDIPKVIDGPKFKSASFVMLHRGYMIGNPNPLLTEAARYLTQCAGSCIKLAPRCFSFDFSRNSGQCHLHGVNSSDIQPTPNEDFSIYELAG